MTPEYGFVKRGIVALQDEDWWGATQMLRSVWDELKRETWRWRGP